MSEKNDMFGYNVLKHMKITHAAYNIMPGPFMQRIKHCVGCRMSQTDFSNNCTVEKISAYIAHSYTWKLRLVLVYNEDYPHKTVEAFHIFQTDSITWKMWISLHTQQSPINRYVTHNEWQDTFIKYTQDTKDPQKMVISKFHANMHIYTWCLSATIINSKNK